MYKLNDNIYAIYRYGTLNRYNQRQLVIGTNANLYYNYIYKVSDRNAANESKYRTTQIAEEYIGNDVYIYGYDVLENITSIKKATRNTAGSNETSHTTAQDYVSYKYDDLGQLTRENLAGKKTSVWNYDELGNITSKSEYAYTTVEDLKNETVNKTVKYYYPNDKITYQDSTKTTKTYSSWNNILVAVDLDGSNDVANNEIIEYDQIGNPTSYLGATLKWNGRQLTSYKTSDKEISYTYDSNGLRTSKTIKNGVKSEYFYVNGQLHYEERSNGTKLYFFYDSNGYLTGIEYNNTMYYPATNRRGDVVAIYNSVGNCIVKYEYDAWGNVISIKNASGSAITDQSHIAHVNPIRYRGYYYDTETGFYLTGTRYYDPEIGRFINADGYVSTGQGVLGNNMFAYCGNNPVNRADPTGMFWKEIGDFFSKAWNGIKTWAKNTFGAGSSTTATIAEIETPVIPDPSPVTVKTGTKTTQTISKHGDSSKPISVYANKDAQHPIKSSSAGININIVNFTLDLSVGLDDIGISGSLTNGNTTNSFGVKLNLSELKIGFEGSTAIQWDNTTETAYTNASISGWAIAAAYILATTGQYVQSPSYAY